MSAKNVKSRLHTFTLGGDLLGESRAAFEEKKALQIFTAAAILISRIYADTFIAGSDPGGLFAPCVKWLRSDTNLPFRKFGCTTTCNL